MTTIAYNHKSKTIAWDSRSCNENVIINNNTQKMIERDGVKFWLSGPVADRENFINWYFGQKSKFTPDCDAFVLANDGLFFCSISKEREFWVEPVDCDYAFGSGGEFALSAMKLGLSAKEAVEHAKTLDCYTGGEVKEFKVG